jgi:hypothetical protein
MRLVSAEFLKLRRRTGLVLAALGLTVVPGLILLAVIGGGDFDTGGVRTFADAVGTIALLTIVSGILVGATLGTSDVSSGVFRELVVTGRSRLDLYAARVPAGLALVLLAAAAGFAIVAVSAFVSAGSVETVVVHGTTELGTVAPSLGLVAQAAGWLALVTVSSFALAFGVASLVGSAGGSIATLLGMWLVVTPLVQGLESLAWLRDVLVVSGLEKVWPDGLQGGDPVTTISLGAAIAVLVAWAALPLLAGAWRTMTRDA